MKIKLTNYPYANFKIGDICDFGEEKNKTLVSMQRAVWYETNPVKKLFTLPTPPPPVKPTSVEEPIHQAADPAKDSQETTPQTSQPKKLVTNKLKQAVYQKKAEIVQAKPAKVSIWDRLK